MVEAISEDPAALGEVVGGKDPMVVSEAAAWTQRWWRRCGVEAHADGGAGAWCELGGGRGGNQ
jgi:hypothetical protein